ncbi:MAG: hypothetical protein WKF40_00160 [Thermoleophilaceae bacterium]
MVADALEAAAGKATDERAGAGATARRGVGGGFLLAARLVMLVVSVIVAIIVVAILLKVLGANMGNSFVKGITDLAKTLVGPFKDLFTIKNAKVSVAVNWGLAALLYLVVGSIIARILRRIGVTSHPDRAR